MPADVAASTLGAAVLDLAKRLDAGPGDRDAASIARELRLALAQLRGWAANTGEDVLDVRDAAMGD